MHEQWSKGTCAVCHNKVIGFCIAFNRVHAHRPRQQVTQDTLTWRLRGRMPTPVKPPTAGRRTMQRSYTQSV